MRVHSLIAWIEPKFPMNENKLFFLSTWNYYFFASKRRHKYSCRLPRHLRYLLSSFSIFLRIAVEINVFIALSIRRKREKKSLTTHWHSGISISSSKYQRYVRHFKLQNYSSIQIHFLQSKYKLYYNPVRFHFRESFVLKKDSIFFSRFSPTFNWSQVRGSWQKFVSTFLPLE